MKKIILLLTFTALFSIQAFADIRPPETKTPTPAAKGKLMDMKIEISSEVTEPTLVIKRGSARALRAELEGTDGSEDNLATTATSGNSFRAQTIIGGGFLSLAMIFGGVWMFRSKPSKTKVGVIVALFVATSTVFVFANIAPPKKYDIDQHLFSPDFQRYAFAKGKVRVRVEAGEMAEDMKLLIPVKGE